MHALEYGLLTAELALKGAHLAAPNSLERGVELPVMTTLLPAELLDYDAQSDVLAVPLLLANSQYFFEALFQSLFDQVSRPLLQRSGPRRLRLLVGGDGRLLNDYSMEILLRVLAANALHLNSNAGGELTVELLTVSSNALSSAAAHAFLASDTDSGQEGEQVMSVALVMKESK